MKRVWFCSWIIIIIGFCAINDFTGLLFDIVVVIVVTGIGIACQCYWYTRVLVGLLRGGVFMEGCWQAPMLTHLLRWSALCLSSDMCLQLTNIFVHHKPKSKIVRIEMLYSLVYQELYKQSWGVCIWWHAPPLWRLSSHFVSKSCNQYQLIRQYQIVQVSMVTRSQDRWLL